jgi:hypothetical protein
MRQQIEQHYRAFLVALGPDDLANDHDERIALVLVASALLETTDCARLALVLGEDPAYLAHLEQSLRSTGIWLGTTPKTESYWKPSGCVALLCDTYTLMGKLRRVVDEFGIVRYTRVQDG